MTLQTLERKVAQIGAVGPSNRAYTLLIEKFPPREIRSASEHRAYRNLAGMLMRELGPNCETGIAEGIRRYLSVAAPFIARFEQTHWPRARSSGREVLAFLMEVHDLTQTELKNEIGAQPYVSDILKGKKNLTAEQIQKLSKRFGVSPAVFFA